MRIQKLVEDLWNAPDTEEGRKWQNTFAPHLSGVIDSLDRGLHRIATPDPKGANGWAVHDWLKKAVILYLQLSRSHVLDHQGGMGEISAQRGLFFDKVQLKCAGWEKKDFLRAGFRVVPGAIIRKGAYIGKDAIIMANAFVNIGAYVGERTMIDAGARVGSCAQVGANVHLSGGAGIGGVLEPPQARPTIIEDDCFIGANSEVAEGVVVKRGAVLSAGTIILGNTPIIDETQGDRVIRGYVPENAVVIMGPHPSKRRNCPYIVKYRDEKTDAKTALNDALRG